MNTIEYPDNRYSGESPWLDKNWLYYMYVVQDYSSKDIADMYGCKPSTITTYVSRYGLEKVPRLIDDISERELVYYYNVEERPPSHIAPLYNATSKDIRDKFKEYGIAMSRTKRKSSIDNYNLEELYKTKSINEIAKISGSNRKTITRKLESMNIPIRDHSQSQMLYNHGEGYSSIYDKINDSSWLYDEYIVNGRSSTDIANELGCNYTTVIRSLEYNNIPIRDASESKIGIFRGDKHPNWKGGITELNMICRQYFYNSIRPIIIERDENKCQICEDSESTLHVHHIYEFHKIINDICSEHSDLDVMDDKYELYNIIINDPIFNEESLLITLCESCHWFDIHEYKMRDDQQPSL